MEKKNMDRVLAYRLSATLDQNALTAVVGGASGSNMTGRIVITGDVSAPDVVVEI